MLSSYWGFLDQYGPNNQGGGRRRGQIHPAVLSPMLQPDDARGGGRARASGMQHSIYRPYNAANMTTSMLLDPHHLPSPGPQQRRGYQHATSSLLEEDEIPSGARSPQHYRSNLGDPFLSTGLSATVGVEDDRSDPEAAAGVLGLLNQFQRVQNGGRVVNI